MTVLIGAGVCIVAAGLLIGVFFIMTEYGRWFVMLGLVALGVGMAGLVGWMVTSGAHGDPPTWMAACALGGIGACFLGCAGVDDDW